MTSSSKFYQVEARESLVDWNNALARHQMVWWCRGSWEPCGLKFKIPRTAESSLSSRLVRALWIEIYEGNCISASQLCRGSWEPCGLKLCSESVAVNLVNVEARESLVDWNKILIHYILNGFVEARESLVDWNPPTLRLANRIYPSRLVRALWIEISE